MAAVLYADYMTDNGQRVISSVNQSGQIVPDTYNCVNCSACYNCDFDCGAGYAANCGGHYVYQSGNQIGLASYNCGVYVQCNCNCNCNCNC